MELKPYLVDVPVRVQIWIRPDCQKKQFEILKQARPSIMFLVSDGGRNDKEWQAIRENRKLFDENIDWECTVYRLYEDKNNGMYTMGRKANELIWNTVDRCVYLEDDYLPAVSFFQYCAELLERYKDDLRIECICGTNLLEKWEKPNSDYFFSRQGSIWGCAYWKRCYDLRNFDYAKDEYVMGLLKQRTSRNKAVWKRINAYANSEFYEGHVAGGEFFHEFAMYGHNQLQIIPKYNLISNIGCTADGEHSDSLDQLPKGIRRAFNIKTYEINFPMKHPKYVIPDVEYEKKRNRLAAYNRPLIAFYRKLERLFRKILKGDFRYIINKIKAKRELEK